MFDAIKNLFKAKPLDPEAVDVKTVKLYIHTHKLFDLAYKSREWGSTNKSRELYQDLQIIRAKANRATNGAINVAFNLPEDFMLDKPLPRATVLSLSF